MRYAMPIFIALLYILISSHYGAPPISYGLRPDENAELVRMLGGHSHSTSRSYSGQGGSSVSHSTSTTISESESDSQSDSETKDVVQRALILPDELMVMRRDEALILVENLNPIKAFKIKWYEDKKLKNLGVNLESKKS